MPTDLALSIEIATTIAGVVSGLFGGIGATILWEAVLKPRRERKSVGRTIAGETSFNLQMIAAQLAAAERFPGSIPADFKLSTRAFDALAPQIGELPTEARLSVLLLYNRIDYLNWTVGYHGQLIDKLRAAAEGSPMHAELRQEIAAAREAFYRLLDRSFETANNTITILHKHIERRWFGEKRRPGDGDTLRDRVHRGLADRDTRLRRK